ncbi:MAG: hypothetical protein KGO96_07470 [Elusimicrobia bacterium]|nr:hypothetical protein [Elusimicrobiota bacterium]
MAEGLINAIDKFVLPYTPVFRSVAIGRMTGNAIETYSDTIVHFYPSDKNKIYRANKVNKEGSDQTVDYDNLSEDINKDVLEKSKITNPVEIRNLMVAASHVSLESTLTSEDGEENETQYEDPRYRPDEIVESNNTYNALRKAYDSLTIFEKKILRMKGIEI